MNKVQCLLLACILLLPATSAARILGVFAHPVRSNSVFTHAVMATLAAAGHNVTVYSAFKPTPGSGFHHVHIPPDNFGLTKYDNFKRDHVNRGFGSSTLRLVSHFKSEAFLKQPKVQKLIYSNETFDLVFTGAFFGEETLLVFGDIFKAPTIALVPLGAWSTIDYITGNSISLAYAPEFMEYPFTDDMSLFQRIQNVITGIASIILYELYDLPRHDAIIRHHTSSLSSPPPPVYQMVRNVALTFVNIHQTVSYPKPLPPNIVKIGGIHTNTVGSPLSQDVQRLMDNATEGVIFCSLGSIVPVESMPRNLLQAFVNTFKNLPQKVIWKISSNALQDIPSNVMVSSWLPQQRILEHPNLKVFLTHGGLSSQLEVLRSGVPVVGLPFFLDQPYNIRVYEQLGVGVALSLETLSEETLTSALKTVLSNTSYVENACREARVYGERPMKPATFVVYWTEYILRHGGTHLRPQAALMTCYAENARRVAHIYADRPMKPADLVVYWTEYILRHGGTHLRPQAALMPWYQRGLLDVLAGFLIVICIVFILILISYRLILRCMRVQ